MSLSPERTPDDLERYSRQVRFSKIGAKGQRRLSAGSVVLIGCGALGTAIANMLVRAGIGRLRIVDRDFVELSNLQRQTLFDEQDVASHLPKSIAAEIKLRAINSLVAIEPIVADVDPANVEMLCRGFDLVLDGTDNFDIRFLINDVSIKRNIPWIYGGCLGTDGQTMTILPGITPCLNCLMPAGPPLPGATPTCDTAGILSTIINLIASIEVNEALKILTGDLAAVNRALTVVSLWENRWRQMDISNLREKVDCPTCHRHEFSWLKGERGSQTAVLCGRNAVQLSFPDREPISLAQLAARLQPFGEIKANDFLVKFWYQDYVLTVFADSRAIISGTDEIAVAKKLYAQFVGN